MHPEGRMDKTMYRYETHLHTSPVSRCADVSVGDTLRFYQSLGYRGVFITNHFLDGNINIDQSAPYEEKIDFYFSDYEEGKKIGQKIGLDVFCGLELSYQGTDFLVYGLSKDWYLAHPEIMRMPKSKELLFLMESGALVIQAHPYREDSYIDHIRLFPRCVQGVEVLNACRKELENRMASLYADAYGLVRTAGSDNHHGARQRLLAGMEADTPLSDEADFIRRVLAGEMKLFTLSV